MGNKIILRDTSGGRLPKKTRANQTEVASTADATLIVQTDSAPPSAIGGAPGGIFGSIQFNDSNTFGGATGFTFNNTYSTLNVGCENILNLSCNSFIIGGGFSLNPPGILGSVNTGHTITNSLGSAIIGGGSIYAYGLPNQISNGEGSTIIGSVSSCTMHGFSSTIIGSALVCATQTNHVSIIGSQFTSSYHDSTISIIGAAHVYSYGNNHSALIGGNNNCMYDSYNSVIIGGTGLTINGMCNTVMVPQLNIASLPIGDPGIPGNVYITGTTPPIQLFVSGLVPSDFRFKNILKKLYTTPEGINVYSYIYKNFVNMEGIFQGVIAQELIGSPFEYALENHGGYFYVNYYKLPGVEFKRID